MGKPRDLLKKTSDNKGILHAKMGTIKDRNGMDLTEAEDIKKRWQEYTFNHCFVLFCFLVFLKPGCIKSYPEELEKILLRLLSCRF